MASGIPIVATNVSDNAYVVNEGETGFLVEVDDVDAMAERLKTLLNDGTRRREMGRKAQKWTSDTFSIEQLVKNTEEVYLQALHEKAHPSQAGNL